MEEKERFENRDGIYDTTIDDYANTDILVNLLNQQDKRISELKQQLAESEKERHEEWKTGKEWKWEWQRVNRQLEQANQDKISFAIEQLEKVKSVINASIRDDHILWDFDIKAHIDNQIKAIKGDNND